MTAGSAGLRVVAFARSDRGLVREGNEDSYFTGSTVFAVADGMGGHVAGEVASKAALEPVTVLDATGFSSTHQAEAALVEAIRAANTAVVGEATSNPEYRGMGTTLTAVMVRDGRLHVAHVGDSRAYLLRRNETITQLTTDHTLVEQLVQEGRLSRDEAATHPQRSVITRAIGVDADVEVDTLPPIALQPGDQVLLCSDGLTGVVSDQAIADILSDTEDGEEAVDHLIDIAIDEGGPDNITVVLLRTDGGGSAAGKASAGARQNPGATSGQAPAPPVDTSTTEVQRIQTRQESGQDWVASMGRFGDRQGVQARPSGQRTGRAGRVLAVLLGVVVLLTVVVGGSWLVLSRAFFVGVTEGQVAVFNGLPQQFAGVRLYWLRETSDVDVDDLPRRKQAALREGIPVGDLGEAERLISGYRDDVEEAREAATPTPTPTPTPRSSPPPTPTSTRSP